MKNSIPNPFIYNQKLEDKWLKDLQYRQLVGFINAKECSDLMRRVQTNNLVENDFMIRDIIFSQSLPEEQKHPNAFQYTKKHLNEYKSIDSGQRYEGIMKECKRKKHLFWKNVLAIPPTTQSIQDSKLIVDESVKKFKQPTQLMFFGISLAISLALKLNLNPIAYRGATVLTGIGFGYLYGEFKYSDQIFYEISELPDKELEIQRQDIVNYCFSVDIDLLSKSLLKIDQKQVESS